MNSSKTIMSGAGLRAALLAAGVLAGALAGVAQAQPVSPTGNWDFVISGAEQGVGFLTFNGDNTLGGWEVVTFRPHNTISTPEIGRNGGGSTTTTTSSSFFFFGFTPVTGNWSVATSGQILGFLTEGDATGVSGSQFSFRGHTRAGKSLVLSTTESPGPTDLDHSARHTVWSGVPEATNVVDLSGTWLAQGSSATVSTNGGSTVGTFTEFLTLTSLPKASNVPSFFTDLAASPFATSSYLITGTGPGYTNFGLALQSSKRRISIVLREGDFLSDVTLLRALEGPLNTNRFTATAGGTDDNGSNVHYRLQRVATPD
jgi:hypothetical protein